MEINERSKASGSSGFKNGLILLIKWPLRLIFASVLALVVLLTTILIYFFATPSFLINKSQINWVIARYAPKNISIQFSDAKIKVDRPLGLPFAKHLGVTLKDFCVHYEGEAVSACFSDVSLALTAGWGGEPLKDEGVSRYLPNLISIDPIRLLGGSVLADLPKLPKSDPNAKPSSINYLDLLRKQILPKWTLDGSRIELFPLKILTSDKDGFIVRADLNTRQQGDTLRARLLEFRMLNSPLNAQAILRVTRPEDWSGQKAPDGQPEAKRAWKLWANGTVHLDRKKQIALLADTTIYDWKTLDFRAGTKWKGIPALREVRLDGALNDNLIDSRLSLKMGAAGSQVKALDFADCSVKADLDKKIGGLKCGPQMVRLQLQERSLIREPNFFLLRPEFDLHATHISFGETKGAQIDFTLNLVHHNYAHLAAKIQGEVHKGPGNDPLHYDINGGANLAVDELQHIVSLLRNTPFEVPAPLNVLAGKLDFNAKLAMTEKGGDAQYLFTSRLDSKSQAVHFKLAGDTLLREIAGSLHPATRLDLSIESLRVSAPRFDLRVPPRFAPDSRFGKINAAANENPPRLPEPEPRKPLDLRLHVHTVQPQAIQIATNLTKAPIPVDLDITYSEKAGATESDTLPPKPNQNIGGVSSSTTADEGSISGSTRSAGDPVNAAPPPVLKDRATEKLSAAGAKIVTTKPAGPAVTGWVQVGRVPVELFRRNATVQLVRVDLLPSGEQKLNGVIGINYLDYDINALLTGTTAQPSVKLVSDPPLSDDNIMAVLLFGRAPDELDQGQKDSVSNTRAALANATLGISSLYLLASTPIESIGYDPEHDTVTAKVGLGGGASVELGGNSDGAAVGFRKKLSHNFVFRSDVENMGISNTRVVSALVEWVKRF